MNKYTISSSLLLALMSVGGALLLYGNVVRGQDSDVGIVRTNTEGEQVDPSRASVKLDQELINELELIASITIDEAFFTTPAFMALREIGRPLPSFSIGRPNPFLLPNVGFVPDTNATSTR